MAAKQKDNSWKYCEVDDVPLVVTIILDYFSNKMPPRDLKDIQNQDQEKIYEIFKSEKKTRNARGYTPVIQTILFQNYQEMCTGISAKEITLGDLKKWSEEKLSSKTNNEEKRADDKVRKVHVRNKRNTLDRFVVKKPTVQVHKNSPNPEESKTFINFDTGELTKFVSALVLFYDARKLTKNVEQIDPDDQCEIFDEYTKILGSENVINLPNILILYGRLCQKLLEIYKHLDLCVLRQWCSEQQGTSVSSPLVASDEQVAIESSTSVNTALLFKNRFVQNNVKFAQQMKFLFMNYEEFEHTKHLKNFAFQLVVDNGGTFVKLEDIDEVQNSDTIVINFGSVNSFVSEFSKQHKQNLYVPDLIFAAMGSGKLQLDNSFLSVDQFETLHVKKKIHLKDEDTNLTEPLRNRDTPCSSSQPVSGFDEILDDADEMHDETDASIDEVPYTIPDNEKPDDENLTERGDDKILMDTSAPDTLSNTLTERLICKDFTVDVQVSCTNMDFLKCFATFLNGNETYKVYVTKQIFNFYVNLQDKDKSIQNCFAAFEENCMNKQAWKAFFPVSKFKEVMRTFMKASPGKQLDLSPITNTFPEIEDFPEFLPLLVDFVSKPN